MLVTAVRYLNDGHELVGYRNFIRGFEVFTIRGEGESLACAVRSHGFNFYDGARGYGTGLLALVVEVETEARRRIGSKDGDLDKAVAEIYEVAIVWSAFGFFRGLRKVMVFAVKATNSMVETQSHHHKLEADN